MRKAMGIRRRRRGNSRRIARGDDARRMKKGTETATMATKTTEVMLRDCICCRVRVREYARVGSRDVLDVPHRVNGLLYKKKKAPRLSLDLA